jgi:hypothetical protein
MSSDPISKALNLTPIQEILPAENIIQKSVGSSSDFDYARGNMLNILEKGNEAVDDMLSVAQQMQHPRAYEVLATLIKTLSDTNKDLMDLHKKKKELEMSDDSQGPKTINNNLFVGSTTELQKLLKNNGKE